MKSNTTKRVAFTTSRELEFFTESELTTQIGHRPGLWPLVLSKELIDNAIDDCEQGQKPIEIGIELDKDSIAITDNGSGITGKIIKGVLDYGSRISDKKHYIAPTRGQLGNALKCVVAAPFVATEKTSLIEIVARGQRYRILIELDRIAQRPKIGCATTQEPRGLGTIVTVHWPEITSYFEAEYGHELYQFDSLHDAVAALVNDYRAFNPHVSFTFNGERFAATNPDWQKWRTDAPTSPHWYRAEDLRNLIAAHINERDKPVRDFIADFAGLARTGVRAEVLKEAKIRGNHLSDLVRGGDVDMKAVTRLLDAMREHSKPVQPQRLGMIGQEHLQSYFESLGAANVKYQRKAFIDNDGLPVVLEIAFAVKPDASQRSRRIFGLNWSPVFQTPSGEIGDAISDCQVQSYDPVILLIHAARPRFEFLSYGKGAIV